MPLCIMLIFITLNLIFFLTTVSASAINNDCGSNTNSTIRSESILGQGRLNRNHQRPSRWPCKGPEGLTLLSEGVHICNWPNGVLKYQISSSFNQEEMNIIRGAVRHLEKKLKGCIKFEERKGGRRVYITNYGPKHPKACPKNPHTSCCAATGYKDEFKNPKKITQNMNLGTWMENLQIYNFSAALAALYLVRFPD